MIKNSKHNTLYIVNTEENRIEEIKPKTFEDFGFKERQHLQEWIAKEPSSLGEDLLIIQKEFDEFADTKERLDLLALDKKGNLVIIENKLDDSGRDVTWQAIKYASYCSSLTKQDVIDMYKKYLGPTHSAEESLSDFFEGKELSEVEINAGNGQRIFFIAANFRKEVTSSVMWLMNFGLQIQCFKVTPYEYDGKCFLDIDQIIPIKDADEYIIKIASKQQAEANEGKQMAERHNRRYEFWAKFIDYCKENKGLFADSSPSKENWIAKSVKGAKGLSVSAVANYDNCRMETTINTGDKTENKEIFDALYREKAAIEASFGQELQWERMDDKITCRIHIDKELSYLDEGQCEQVFEFLADAGKRMMATFDKFADKKK
ncbi:MAG: DUF4268 domain-containing protein [Bacteroidaceae bacterium]|nr:DUF4268 domain-containing protein [Bacteroidaceae bacterium]